MQRFLTLRWGAPRWKTPRLCAVVFVVFPTLGRPAVEFQNTGGITISAAGNAVPHPSVITVSGMGQHLSLLKVKLNGLSHALPQEMEMHLVSPGGQVRTLLWHVGGVAPLSGADLTFTDSAAQAPRDDEALADGAQYRSRVFPGEEPLPPGATDRTVTTLARMGLGGVNGDWKLFVSDDSFLNINGGSLVSWSLLVEDERMISTGLMSGPRWRHTATQLPDGRVLVAGGTSDPPGTVQPVALATAELYDPNTGTWRSTGSMKSGRFGHTASLLPNGLVLLAGGVSGPNVLASAELFDPATGEWSATGNLSAARRSHSAVVLPDRRVLVCGGRDSASVLAGVEIYQPATGLWSAANPMATGRQNHAATLLADGRLLVSGGFSAASARLASAELFNPVTGNWSAAGALGTARAGHTATLLRNGSVVALSGGSSFVSAEVYLPALNQWTQLTAPVNSPQGEMTASLLPSGRLLAVGPLLADLRILDPAAGTWSSGGRLPEAAGTGLPEYHSATVLPSGRVLIAGGQRGGTARAEAFLFDPSLGVWTGTGALAEYKYAHRANLLADGRVLASGGWNAAGITGNCQLYNPAAGTWANTGPLNLARAYHTTTLMPWGTVLAIGGTVSGIFVASAEQFDPAAGTWSTINPPPSVPRAYHTATQLPAGRILVAGGNGNGGTINDSVEIYDAYDPQRWTTADPLITARTAHTATLLPDGRVLVAGGRNATTFFNSAEIYDPQADAWSGTGAMHFVRYFHSALLLPSGKVLIVGGQADFGSVVNVAELYDPLTGVWETSGQMNFAPHPLSLTLLPDGRVFTAGGATGTTLRTAEIYDPATGRWTVTAPLAAARSLHTATRLVDGRILVAGGNDGAALTSSEIYDPGKGFAPGDRPVLTAAAVDSIDRLVMTGDRFLGQHGASGGNGSADSSTPYPQVQWHCLENGQTLFLPPDRLVTVTPGGFTTVPTSRGTPGLFLATVFANGIPSISRVVTPDYDHTIQPIELWRLRHFGNSANTGDGANGFDFERDSVPNIVEYGLGLHPRQNSASQMPEWRIIEESGQRFWFLEFNHPAGVSGVAYSAERTGNLHNGLWSPLNDLGGGASHSFAFPMNLAPTRHFFRLRVTEQ